MNRGKLAVLSILVLAVALAGFALWWNVTGGRRPLEFWGREAGARIISPEATVELLWLEPAGEDFPHERLSIGGRSYALVGQQDVTKAPGLVHARHSLLADASFDWQSPAASGNYTIAARFRGGSGVTTVAFDFAAGQLAHVEFGREAKGAEKIIEGWQTFARRHTTSHSKSAE